jgi:diguanylate cyclase (GGDEF)-like protein
MVEANAEWAAISRLGAAESAGDGWLSAIHPDDRMDAAEFVAATASQSDVDLSLRIVPAHGSTSWFRGHCRRVDDHDEESRLLTLTAVGAHRTNEARLLHMSTHDGLTGLSNRAGFAGTANRTLSAGTDLAGVLFIDLDHFKIVNDHLGHRVGDNVLRAASNRIESTIRSTDLAGRLGGDEIGVFCLHVTSSGELFSLAERIGQALATPFSIEGKTVVIDASIGVAFTSETVRTAEALIDAADRAMYVAKAAGGGRWATLDAAGEASPSTASVADAPTLLAARADVDRAEERIRQAWQHSTRRHDDERSVQLVAIREALRAASLLIRASADVGDPTLADEPIDGRPDRLQSTLEDGQAVGYAVGMIGQQLGVHAAEASARLRAYAAFAGVSVATAGRMVVEREVDIDVLMSTPTVPATPR